MHITAQLAGAVWAHLVGDAIGVPYEFTRGPIKASTIQWGHKGTWNQPPGTWSDDGGLTLALLDSLLSVGFDMGDQARRAVTWLDGPDYKPGPRFDLGGTVGRALRQYKAGTPARLCGGSQEMDNGNGSLMRILPVSLVGWGRPDETLIRWAGQASSVTHAHARSRAVCALYTPVVRDLLRGRQDLDAVIRSALDVAGDDQLQAVMSGQKRTGSGYVVDTFVCAWEAFHGGTSYADTIRRAIAYGNDTDTTAAVAGGLAGARYGLGGIPAEWLAEMRGKDIVEPLIERLTGQDEPQATELS
jgi:ADP-ribosylglycohydrolase